MKRVRTTPTRYEQFQHTMNLRVGGTRLKLCSHESGSQLRIDGVRFKCCSGSAGTCKVEEMEYLMRKCQSLCNEIDRIESYNENLRQKNAFLKSRESDRHDQLAQALATQPQAVHHTTNNTYNVMQVNMFPGELFNSKAKDIIQETLEGADIFATAYKYLLLMPPSKEKDKLVTDYNSSELDDKLAFRREVVQNLDSGIIDITDEATKRYVSESLDKMDAQIDIEYEQNGIPTKSTQ